MIPGQMNTEEVLREIILQFAGEDLQNHLMFSLYTQLIIEKATTCPSS